MAVAFSGITVYAKVIQPKKYGEYIEQGNPASAANKELKGINISSYFPDKAQEIRNYRNAFEQEKYNREQSAIEDAKLAGGGNGWVLDVISQNRDSAREKCYEVINKYM